MNSGGFSGNGSSSLLRYFVWRVLSPLGSETRERINNASELFGNEVQGLESQNPRA